MDSLLLCPHVALSLHMPISSVSSSYKDTSSIGLGLSFMISFNLNYIFKKTLSISKCSYKGVSAPTYEFFGYTIQSTTHNVFPLTYIDTKQNSKESSHFLIFQKIYKPFHPQYSGTSFFSFGVSSLSCQSQWIALKTFTIYPTVSIKKICSKFKTVK